VEVENLKQTITMTERQVHRQKILAPFLAPFRIMKKKAIVIQVSVFSSSDGIDGIAFFKDPGIIFSIII
jgi:hypothetical protein